MASKIAFRGSKLVRLRELRPVYVYVEDGQRASSLHAGTDNVVVVGDSVDIDDLSISSIAVRSLPAFGTHNS